MYFEALFCARNCGQRTLCTFHATSYDNNDAHACGSQLHKRTFFFVQRCLNFGIRSGCVVVALNNICIYMCRHTSPTTLHGMSFIIRACACTSTAYGKVFECKRTVRWLLRGGRWVIHAASSRCTRFGESCCASH